MEIQSKCLAIAQPRLPEMEDQLTKIETQLTEPEAQLLLQQQVTSLETLFYANCSLEFVCSLHQSTTVCGVIFVVVVACQLLYCS